MSQPASPDEAKNSKVSLPPISSLIDTANGAPENNMDRSPGDSRTPRTGAGSQTPTYTERQMTYPSSPSATAASYPNYPDPSQHHYNQRQSAYPPLPQTQSWLPSQPAHPQQHPTYPSPHASPSTPSSSTQHISPTDYPPPNGLTYQRPLPGFPPATPYSTDQPYFPYQAPNTHHHYFPPTSSLHGTSSSPFPQTQDRYICPTCAKHFSRPSSLKIHTYSHTGEKPYKCKVEGCGKWFSVRSNMKRHEKGCHGESGGGGSQGRASPGGA